MLRLFHFMFRTFSRPLFHGTMPSVLPHRSVLTKSNFFTCIDWKNFELNYLPVTSQFRWGTSLLKIQLLVFFPEMVNLWRQFRSLLSSYANSLLWSNTPPHLQFTFCFLGFPRTLLVTDSPPLYYLRETIPITHSSSLCFSSDIPLMLVWIKSAFLRNNLIFI
jgi:hypothetical protein